MATLGNTAPRDANQVPALLGTSSTTGETVTVYADPSTHRLLVNTGGGSSSLSVTDGTTTVTGVTTIDFTSGATVMGSTGTADVAISGSGSGTVTSVSVATANGFSGTVANPTTTPAITIIAGAITPTSVNGLTITTTTGTLTISGSKVLTISNSLTLAGTDSTTMTFPSTSATIARTDAGQTFSGTDIFSILNATTYQTANGQGGYIPSTGVFTYQNGLIGFSSGNNSSNTADSAFSRISAGVIGVGTGAQGSIAGTLSVATIELGNASDTALTRSSAGVLQVAGVVIPSISSTNTLTNKRITRRLTTVNAPGATPSTNTDNVDIANFTGLATAITSMTTNLTGTPVDGQLVEFRFTDAGSPEAITWGASFGSTTVTLPTTTVASTMLRVLVEWNATASLYQCIAVA